MSERQSPDFLSPEQAQAKRDQLRAELEDLDRQEAWGLHDVTAPNKGEVTAREYFNDRPEYKGRHAKTADHYYDETLEADDYSGGSLKELAERVAKARAEGDKTRAQDAEDAFFEKFTTMAEKYGWEEEDGSAGDTLRVDKDAKIGRSTVDDRLARYSKIMYGEEADTAVKSPEMTADEEVTSETTTPTETAEETTGAPEQKTFNVNTEVEQAKERLHKLAEEREQQASEQRNGGEAAQSDRELIARVSKEGLDDEPRIKRVSTEGLVTEETVEIPRVSTEGLDDGEVVEPARPEKGFLNRARRALHKSKELYLRAAFEFGHTFDLAKSELSKRGGRKSGETEEQYERRMRRNGQGIALGIVAIAGASIASKYGAFDGIFDAPANGGTGIGEGQNNTEEAVVNKNRLVDHLSREQISDFKIPEGSGGEALMDRLGVDKQVWYENQNEFLRKFPNEAYRMPDGNVGFTDSNRLSNDAIKFWAKKSSIWH